MASVVPKLCVAESLHGGSATCFLPWFSNQSLQRKNGNRGSCLPTGYFSYTYGFPTVLAMILG
ncbi:hypothetical protein Pyn_08793 [Prunus yedoensis var. nudiflora]|uniref:Uncharacterized protein n=1 Tax=Prunus yedoensis var. nudiflora TaxID=2094558 RepID=A0A314ZBA6_PRUYE|nr:hypothetical protein Pyn_08793 [Prunus yedoensis var. nudiflora]